MSTAAQKTVKDLKQLPLHGFKYGEHEQAHIVVTITDLLTTPQDVCRPEFWANHGKTLKQCLQGHAFPKLDVIWSDGSKHMELLCVKADNLYAHMLVKSLTYLKRPAEFFKEFDADEMESINVVSHKPEKIESNKNEPLREANDPENYVALYIGKKRKFGVQRKSDSEYLAEGLESKAAAEVWLQEYLSAM